MKLSAIVILLIAGCASQPPISPQSYQPTAADTILDLLSTHIQNRALRGG